MNENGMTFEDIICQSIDTIVTERLRTINFDTTLTCTIEDNSKATNGIYTVNDGSVKFTAYSTDPSFKIGDSVYVQIPNNDFSEQKIIVGLKPKVDTNQPYDYSQPFDSFVKGTENLVINSSETYGLKANGENKSLKIHLSNNYGKTEIPYTHIGIRANFKSVLPDSVVSGNYGLAYSALESIELNKAKLDTNALDCTKMYGNPYQYFVYTTQEVVYELSDQLNSLDDLQLFFFQESNFIGLTSESVENEDNDLFDFLEDNRVDMVNNYDLFVTDIEVYLGYDSVQLEGNQLAIYAEDKKYEYNTNTTKNIKLEWFLGYNNSLKTQVVSSEFLPKDREIKNNISTYKGKVNMSCWKTGVDTYGNNVYQGVRWYRKRIGVSAPDDYAGAGWEIINPIVAEGIDHQLILKTQLSETKPSESFKAIIFEGVQFVNVDLETNELYNDEELNLERFKTENQEIVEKGIEYKILCDNIIESNILVFENTAYVSIIESNKQAMLSINTPDIQNGNYFNYGLSGAIVPDALSREERKLEPYFQGERLESTRSCVVEWIIPIRNTMIQPTSYRLWGDNLERLKAKENVEIKYLDVFKQEVDNQYNATYCKIKIDNQKKQLSTQYEAFVLTYMIDRQLKPQYTNNNIECRVYMNDNSYITNKKLSFGRNGTSGTEVVLYLLCEKYDINTGISIDESSTVGIVNINDKNEQYFKIVPHLQLGSTGEEIEINEIDHKFEYSWISINGENSIPVDLNGEGLLPLEKRVKFIANRQESYLILRATMKYGTGVQLTSFLPFVFTGKINDNDYASYPSGIFEIIYNSASGLPFETYTTPYHLDNVKDVSWELDINDGPKNTEDKTWRSFYPTIDENTNILVPVSIYTSGIKEVAVRAYKTEKGEKKTLWYSPLIIEKNKWPNSLINSWDGNFALDENNNTIKSAMMMAGTKTNDNKFSGVIMGQAQGDSDLHGLYGYSEGEQAFAFKEDGTAFIGKEGRGRINFDGTSATIKSANIGEENDNIGIIIDLDGDVNNQPSILLNYKRPKDEETESDFTTIITPQGMTIERGSYQVKTDEGDSIRVSDITLLDVDKEKLLIPRLTVSEGIHFKTNNIILKDTVPQYIPLTYLADQANLNTYLKSMEWTWKNYDTATKDFDTPNNMILAIESLGDYTIEEIGEEEEKIPLYVFKLNADEFDIYPYNDCTVLIPKNNPFQNEETKQGLYELNNISKKVTNQILETIMPKESADYIAGKGLIMCCNDSLFVSESPPIVQSNEEEISTFSLLDNTQQVEYGNNDVCSECGRNINDIENYQMGFRSGMYNQYKFYCQECLENITEYRCCHCNKKLLRDDEDTKHIQQYDNTTMFFCSECYEKVKNWNLEPDTEVECYCCTQHKLQQRREDFGYIQLNEEGQLVVYCSECYLNHPPIISCTKCNTVLDEDEEIYMAYTNNFYKMPLCSQCWSTLQEISEEEDNTNNNFFDQWFDWQMDLINLLLKLINLVAMIDNAIYNQPLMIHKDHVENGFTNSNLITSYGKDKMFSGNKEDYLSIYFLTPNADNADLKIKNSNQAAENKDPILSFIHAKYKNQGVDL